MIEKALAFFACVMIRTTIGDDACGQKADVVFILDSSRSIWLPDYRLQLAFVSDLVSKLNVGPDTTHVGVVSFSTGAKVEIHLHALNHDIPALQNMIKSIRFQSGDYTDTHAALKLAREEMFLEKNGARPDVPRLIIVITDGVSRYKTETKNEAQLLREQGIKVFVVGIGEKLDRTHLGEIATEDTEEYVYSVNSFKDLPSHEGLIVLQACKGAGELGADELNCKISAGPADVMYIMDATHADKSEIEHNLHLIKKVTEGLGVGEGRIRVGLTSNNCPDVGDIGLELAKSAEEFANAVTSLVSSATPLANIIRRAKRKLTDEKKGAREGVKRIAVVFVHGPIVDLKAATYEVRNAMSASYNPGVEFIFVGMGQTVDEKQIQRLYGKKPLSKVRILVDEPGQPRLTWENVHNEICKVLLPDKG